MTKDHLRSTGVHLPIHLRLVKAHLKVHLRTTKVYVHLIAP